MKPKRSTPPPEIILESEMRNLPDVTRGRQYQWSPQEDRMILKYCPPKGVSAVAALLHRPVESVRRRFSTLSGKAVK